MVCILKISAWILFKKLRFVRILKDFPWQCEKLYSHAWVCQICGITILSRFHTRCQSRHWSVTRFLKLSHNNKDIKFSQLLTDPPMLYMSRQRFIHLLYISRSGFQMYFGGRRMSTMSSYSDLFHAKLISSHSWKKKIIISKKGLLCLIKCWEREKMPKCWLD